MVSVVVCFMQESHKPTILRRRLKQESRQESRRGARRESPTGEKQNSPTAQGEHSAIFRDFITKVLFRPFHMACVEPVVGFFTLYISINFGMVYGSS
jgi:hypothetical protein